MGQLGVLQTLRSSAALRRRRGFTLIELLVVLAIIAILMGILIPALAKVREIAKERKAGKQIKDIADAAGIYSQRFTAMPPDTEDCNAGLAEGDQHNLPDKAADIYTQSIHRYLGSDLVDNETGIAHERCLQINPADLIAPEVTVDGKKYKVYADPWGTPYRLDAKHVYVYITGDTKELKKEERGAPYPPATGSNDEKAAAIAKRTKEVKVWSYGLDKKSATVPFSHRDDSQPRAGYDVDNFASWE